jgi:hypothetical protein
LSIENENFFFLTRALRARSNIFAALDSVIGGYEVES